MTEVIIQEVIPYDDDCFIIFKPDSIYVCHKGELPKELKEIKGADDIRSK